MSLFETGVWGRSPHTGPRSDVLVLGGGLAGLSAVSALVDQGLEESIHIFERRSRDQYVRDRTWCMWDVGENPLAKLATHRWHDWIVRDESRVVHAHSDEHPYLRLPADLVYDHLVRKAEAAPNVHFHFGSSADRVDRTEAGVQIATPRGEFAGRLALDSRPRRGRPSRNSLLQSFVGWEVRTRDPVFDPTVVTLMDFRLCTPGAIEFFYVLPLTENRALVESTVFAPSVVGREYHKQRIKTYIQRTLNTSLEEIEYSEQGVIPMGFDHAPRSDLSGVLDIGLRGGVAKPSTGYAFRRIQDDSIRLAHNVAHRDSPPSARGSSARSQVLDRIFLSFLRHQPDLAPNAFLDLFDRVPADDLIRFLTETGSVAVDLRVVRALRPIPFLKEILRFAQPSLRWPANPAEAMRFDRDEHSVLRAQ